MTLLSSLAWTECDYIRVSKLHQKTRLIIHSTVIVALTDSEVVIWSAGCLLRTRGSQSHCKPRIEAFLGNRLPPHEIHPSPSLLLWQMVWEFVYLKVGSSYMNPQDLENPLQARSNSAGRCFYIAYQSQRTYMAPILWHALLNNWSVFCVSCSRVHLVRWESVLDKGCSSQPRRGSFPYSTLSNRQLVDKWLSSPNFHQGGSQANLFWLSCRREKCLRRTVLKLSEFPLLR